jgi:protein AFG1
MLAAYDPPIVKEPTVASLQPKRASFLSSFFGRGGQTAQRTMDFPSELPKGLYMFGDVGSGKTMMMDLFYDTLPESIKRATRIHFHNFMQEVHRELHKFKMQHGQDIDAIPFVAAHIAKRSTVLCFDEFQCTDVADAMILRRLVEFLMHHGTVIVTTSNRHPKDLYKNGVQRESFIPCINLLQRQLRVLNLDSPTDYRRIPRPPSGVYHFPLDKAASSHIAHWFRYLGDFEKDPPHAAEQHVWGRPIQVPRASGKAAHFTFDELIGRATGAADYIELMRNYDAFVVSDVPQMDHRSRDKARRFITFIDAVYESHAKLVLTTAVPLTELFLSREEVDEVIQKAAQKGNADAKAALSDGSDVDDVMRQMMDDLGMNMSMLKKSNFFSGDEEAFAFARAQSRLSEMGSKMWVERGMGENTTGKDSFAKLRSRWKEDSM